RLLHGFPEKGITAETDMRQSDVLAIFQHCHQKLTGNAPVLLCGNAFLDHEPASEFVYVLADRNFFSRDSMRKDIADEMGSSSGVQTKTTGHLTRVVDAQQVNSGVGVELIDISPIDSFECFPATPPDINVVAK